ncbi:MAG: glycosyltransferase family 1 protein [Proteobacteria bacterium]|nr:glycosyltransferase family 1 protein [Pseudomonadota bacterium]
MTREGTQKHKRSRAIHKILFVSDAWYPQMNGVVHAISKTKAELEALGLRVALITPNGFWSLPCPSYPEIRLCLFPRQQVAQLIKAHNPDSIHIVTEGPLGLAARNYATRHNLAFTTAYHTRFPEYVRVRFRIPLSWTYAYLRWFHRPATATMVSTPSIAKALHQWRVGTPVLCRQGVDLGLFKPNPKLAPKRGKPVYLYVGRVAVEKNLEAFLQCPLDGEKWIVGDGPQRKQLKSRYGKGDQVTFWGAKPLTQLPDLYSQASVFVFPSKTDTFGLVLLEAMACGVPVAAYPVAGPLDVVGGAKAAALNEDLAVACRKALTLNRREARRHAEKYSWHNATKTFQKHLVHVYNHAHARQSP